MSTDSYPCFCAKPGCTGTTKYHDDKVMKRLIVSWQAAMKAARNGFDEEANNERVVGLAAEISAELAHCSANTKRHCAELGIYPAEPVDVGQRDLSR